MLDKESMLVNWLPYDSIDVVFNNKNLYANRQNHNPALIKYDFPDDTKEFEERKDQWLAFLQPEDLEKMDAKSIKINPAGDKNVSLARSYDIDMAAKLKKDIASEL